MEEKITSPQVAIEALLNFAVTNGLMEDSDVIYTRNQIFSYLKISAINEEQLHNPEQLYNGCKTASSMLKFLVDDYIIRGHMEDTQDKRDSMEAGIMNLMMPRPSEINKEFWERYAKDPADATDYFYKLCRASNYIQVDRVNQNIKWDVASPYGDIEITINLSKPEKDPKDIAAARNKPPSGYPKCLLCVENTGFEGTHSHPARQNLRAIPIKINNENWYLQYSPYVYYSEHSIIFNERHTPMKISGQTFHKLIEFVKAFPHYFIGSNADLPIVGGSILTHDHFQGGRHRFPLERAAAYAEYRHTKYPDIAISQVAWPMSVVRLTAATMDSEGQLCELANHILNNWRNYSNSAADIYAFTGDTPHNTITPIARLNVNGQLELDLVLRNNRTTKEYPDGLFHPHPDKHHIKKENIGLIEVMGLAILPGRLQETLKQGTKEEEIKIKNEMGQVFLEVLHDCGVFKDTDAGREQFKEFIKHILN
ncbi:MAG: UDP-glucose--hexose-1-phosphate uridylyltransferase [Defluviitaleaceae bacterium]|nr:UDP-glucose--hexose-1-phosphate uridylyltransferase [Defluviitaleaceae bacterium]